MVLFKHHKLRIVIEGCDNVIVDHNKAHADVQIEIRNAEYVEIRGNNADESKWWKKPLGIFALSVAASVTAGLVIVELKFILGGKSTQRSITTETATETATTISIILSPLNQKPGLPAGFPCRLLAQNCPPSRNPPGTRGRLDSSQVPAFASRPAAGAWSLNKGRCAAMSSARQSLGSSVQGRSSGPIPSEPATARMSTAPSLESRVSPLASSACCAPASSQSFNFCAAMPRQRRTAESFASGPGSRVIQKRATSAAIGTLAAPASPSERSPPHPDAACPREQRGCGHPRLAGDKNVHANPKVRKLKIRRFEVPPIPAARQNPRWSGSSVYSPRLPSVAPGQARRAPR